MELENLIWIIPLAAVVVAVVFTLCSCAVAGDYDKSSERDAAALTEG